MPGSGWKLGSSLQRLALSACNLTGTINRELALPPTLHWLSLHLNNLSGVLWFLVSGIWLQPVQAMVMLQRRSRLCWTAC